VRDRTHLQPAASGPAAAAQFNRVFHQNGGRANSSGGKIDIQTSALVRLLLLANDAAGRLAADRGSPLYQKASGQWSSEIPPATQFVRLMDEDGQIIQGSVCETELTRLQICPG
jgi:hypothetical protein